MADVGSVLDHLLDGRAVLVAEVDRLTAAIADLDSVIARLGGAGAAPGPGGAVSPPTGQPVSAPRGAARRTPPRRPPARPAAANGEGGKSIRVHVLEMLESEGREMGLAEIIDRVHAAGIQAHDDAVRSITIKLMKDGKVERVGRGQYRLADRAAAEPSVPADGATPAEESPAVPPAGEAPVPAGTPAYTPPLNLGQPWQQR